MSATTSQQPSLWSFVTPPVADRPLTIQERTDQFLKANPWVLDELHRMAHELRMVGRRHIGIKCLVEVLRFNYYRQAQDPDSEWHLNNTYTSRIVRLLIEREPELAPLFELRRLKTP